MQKIKKRRLVLSKTCLIVLDAAVFLYLHFEWIMCYVVLCYCYCRSEGGLSLSTVDQDDAVKSQDPDAQDAVEIGTDEGGLPLSTMYQDDAVKFQGSRCTGCC